MPRVGRGRGNGQEVPAEPLDRVYAIAESRPGDRPASAERFVVAASASAALGTVEVGEEVRGHVYTVRFVGEARRA